MLPLFSLFVQTANAAENNPPGLGPVGGLGSVNVSGSQKIITNIYGEVFLILTLLAGVLAVIHLVWYGIQYITAGGAADKAKAARAGIINAVIGIVIVIAAYAIIRVAITIGKQVSNASGATTTIQPSGSSLTGTDTGSSSTGTGGSTGTGTGGTGTGGSTTSENVTVTFKTIDIAASNAAGSDVPAPFTTLIFDNKGLVNTDVNGNATYAITSNVAHTIHAASTPNGKSLQCQSATTFTGAGTLTIGLSPVAEGSNDCQFKFSATPTTGGGAAATKRRELTVSFVTRNSQPITAPATLSLNGVSQSLTGASSNLLVLVGDPTRQFTLSASTADQTLSCESNNQVFDESGTLVVRLVPKGSADMSCATTYSISTQ